MPNYFSYDVLDNVDITSETILYIVPYTYQNTEVYYLRAASPELFASLRQDAETRVEHYWLASLLPTEGSENYATFFPDNQLTLKPLLRENIVPYLLS
jgi:hypothetical protein